MSIVKVNAGKVDYLLIKLSTKWYLVGKSGIYSYISTQIDI